MAPDYGVISASTSIGVAETLSRRVSMRRIGQPAGTGMREPRRPGRQRDEALAPAYAGLISPMLMLDWLALRHGLSLSLCRAFESSHCIYFASFPEFAATSMINTLNTILIHTSFSPDGRRLSRQILPTWFIVPSNYLLPPSLCAELPACRRQPSPEFQQPLA